MTTKCQNCGSENFTEAKVNRTLEINDKINYVKNISALVCDICQDAYFTSQVQRETMKIISEKNKMIKVIETEVYEF